MLDLKISRHINEELEVEVSPDIVLDTEDRHNVREIVLIYKTRQFAVNNELRMWIDWKTSLTHTNPELG